MKKQRDYTGTVYGKWTMVRRSPRKAKDGRYRHWFCRCECGTEKEVSISNLVSGSSTSCGQRQCHFRAIGEGEAAFRELFHRYKSSAKTRDIDWNLTLEQFRKFTKQKCHYCLAEPSQVIGPSKGANTGDYVHTGVDRKNSQRGYTTRNCVPCCTKCNYSKRDLSYKDFLDMVKRIYENHFP